MYHKGLGRAGPARSRARRRSGALRFRSIEGSMQSQTRTSIGFLLVGLLGVLVGALIVACVPGKLLNSGAAVQSYTASASPVRNADPGDLEQRIIAAVKNAEPSVVLIKS